MNKASELHVSSFALSAGIIWGLGVFLLAFFSLMWGYASAWTELLGNVYVGVEATWKGAFVGLVWGFVDAFIGAFVFAHLYNFFLKKFK